MSVSVEGQKCPVCNKYLFDDDEVVFCPICGAPHHKECYARINHCALEQYHNTEIQYKPPGLDEQEVAQNNGDNQDHESRPCPNCGFPLPDQARFCPNCKYPVDPKFAGGMPFIYILPGEFDPYGGVNNNERVESVSAEEFKNYVVINTQKYIPKFFKLKKSAKMSWNWAAFLFPEGWFFYRKVYSIGVVAFVLTICTSLLGTGLNTLFEQISQSVPVDYFKNFSQVVLYLLENIDKFDKYPIYMAMAGGVLELVVRIVFGIFGDWFYRANAIEQIKKIRQDPEIEDYSLALRAKGGINPFLAAAAIFGSNWIVNILFQLI